MPSGGSGGDDVSFTAAQFEFEVEERIQCVESGKVRYVTRRENVLPLEVPVDAATNKLEVERERELKRQKTESADTADKADAKRMTTRNRSGQSSLSTRASPRSPRTRPWTTSTPPRFNARVSRRSGPD